MAVAAALIASAVIAGGSAIISSSKQRKAVQESSEASVAAQEIAQTRSEELTAPLREAELRQLGDTETARNQLLNILGIGDQQVDLSGIQIPGQEFQIAEGQRAIERSAAARGGLLSGATLAELQQRGQGIAQQNFLSNFLNPLQALAQPGSAPGTLQAGQNALNLGLNIGGTLQQAGAQRANILGEGIAGASGAIQGGLSNFLLLRQLNAQSGAGTTPGGVV